MNGRIVTPAEWRAEPWKNGRGVTHVIARWPEFEDTGDYDVRISVAKVTEGGPFSTFPGYQRFTTLLDDGRVGLDDGGAMRWLVHGVPLRLDGSAALVATVERPAHLLNIVARDAVVGRGAAPAARFVFALSPCAGLARWEARLFAQPTAIDDGDVVWVG